MVRRSAEGAPAPHVRAADPAASTRKRKAVAPARPARTAKAPNSRKAEPAGGPARPPKAAEQGPSARKAILDAAVAALEDKGESTIRVSQIAAKARVALGLIYYHFNDREGLVSAAQIERLRRARSDDMTLMDAAVRLYDNPEHFTTMIARILSSAISTDRAAERLDRVAILGASKGRPALTADLARSQQAITDRFTSIIEVAKGRGIIADDVDARSFAIFVQAFGLGLILADIDEKPVDRRALAMVFLRSLGGLAGRAATGPSAAASPAGARRASGRETPRRPR